MSTKPSDADELGLHWEEDTIYSEAKVDPADVIYEGSDDEHYGSAEARKKRYVAAGYRFLQGRTPVTLSASLRGPFEASTGWKSPWASKFQSCGGKCRNYGVSARHSKLPTTAQPQKTFASQESHLPSPESLKQASLASTPRRFDEEEDELTQVQQWRSATTRGQTGWQSWAPVNSSAQKRKPTISKSSSSFSAKRRKTHGQTQSNSVSRSPLDRTERFLLSQPPRRGCRSTFDDPLKISFCSAPDQMQTQSPPPEEDEPFGKMRESHSQPTPSKAISVAVCDPLEPPPRTQTFPPAREPSPIGRSQKVIDKESQSSPPRPQERSNDVNPKLERRVKRKERVRVPITPTSMVTRGQRRRESRNDNDVAPRPSGRIETCIAQAEDTETEARSAQEAHPVDARSQGVSHELLARRKLGRRTGKTVEVQKTAAYGIQPRASGSEDDGPRQRTRRYVTPEPNPSSELSEIGAFEQPFTPEGIVRCLNAISASRAETLEVDVAPIASELGECIPEPARPHGLRCDDADPYDAAGFEYRPTFAGKHTEDETSTEAVSLLESSRADSFEDSAHFSFSSFMSRLVPTTSWSSLGGAIKPFPPSVIPDEVSQGPLEMPQSGGATQAMSETTTEKHDHLTTNFHEPTRQDLAASDHNKFTSHHEVSFPMEKTLEEDLHVVEPEPEVWSAELQGRANAEMTSTVAAEVICHMDIDTSVDGDADQGQAAETQSEISDRGGMAESSFGDSTISRCKTPEPLFSFKSMASFISPSPQRIRRLRLPINPNTNTRAAVKSALKAPWGWRNNTRRVSWAPMVGELSRSVGQGCDSASIQRSRQASPPPESALNLSATDDLNFQHHFSVMAQRLREENRPIDCQPANSLQQPADTAGMQCSLQEADALDLKHRGAMDEAADVRHTVTATARDTNMDRGSSEDPMDIVEDVFNEMADFLQTWDVDAELEMAKKTPGVGVV